jgi:phosphocarrier protein
MASKWLRNDHSLHRDLVIVNELGLHARSAAQLAKIAQSADKEIWVQLGDQRVDAKQVIDLLTLAAAKGDTIRVSITSPLDMETLDRIAALVASGFGE